MGNIPLFCWGDDFEPKLDKDGYLIDKRRDDKTVVSKPIVRRTYVVNPETFFLLTV
jgi:hypothetical protein